MYAVVQWRESLRALRKSKRWDYSQSDLWARTKGSSLQAAYSSLPPLNAWKSEIRLMHLQPGSGDEPIRCTLESISLDEAPAYEALSYAWSQSDEPEKLAAASLDVNGTAIQILPNLSHALEHLRYPSGKTRALWVDFICINQSDRRERNAQVQRMGEIYQKASKVICWIGNSDPETPIALKLLEEILTDDKHLGDYFEGEDAEVSSQRCGALDRLLCRPWFSRVWTVQEIALANTGVIMCGDFVVPWQVIRTADERFMHHWLCCAFPIQSIKNLVELTASANKAALRGGDGIHRYLHNTMCEIVSLTANNHATDPRDFIYGVQGLLNPVIHALKVDYDLPVVAVFRRAAVEMMRHESRIAYLIRMFPGDRDSSVLEELPSFVSDFSHLEPDWSLCRKYPLYQACGQWKKPDFHVLDEQTVTYGGLVVDTVSIVGDDLELDIGITCVAEAREVFSHLQHLEELVKTHEKAIRLVETDKAAMKQTGDDDESSSQPGLTPLLSSLYRTLCFGATSAEPVIAVRLDNRHIPLYVAARCALVKYAESPLETSTSELFISLTSSGTLNYSLDYTHFVCCWRFYITEGGRMGMGPKNIQAGDKVVVLKGGIVPFVMRPNGERAGWTEKKLAYKFLGPTYVDGIMDGEAVCDVLDAGWRPKLHKHGDERSEKRKEWTDVYLV